MIATIADYQRRSLFEAVALVSGGVAAGDPVIELQNASAHDNGPGIGPNCYLGIHKIEIQLLENTPTSLVLNRAVPGSYMTSINGQRVTPTNDADPVLNGDGIVNTAWTSPPSRWDGLDHQQGLLVAQGDKLVWTWPEDAPLMVTYEDFQFVMTIFNSGIGATGDLSFYFLWQEIIAPPASF
jgi:hypothetical protein